VPDLQNTNACLGKLLLEKKEYYDTLQNMEIHELISNV
jgi:hypothetical protein